jgi:hypothetical protein
MAKGQEAGKTFLAGVLAKLPENLRGNAEALFGDATFQTVIGDGTLAQSEFSRLTNELQTQQQELETRRQDVEGREASVEKWHGELTTWYDANKELVKKAKEGGDGVKPNGNPNPNPGAGGTPPGGFTPEQMEERIAQERAGYLNFAVDQNDLQREHFSKFGEFLDLRPLLMHKDVAAMGLRGVYGLVHKERLEKHATDAQAAHDKKVADEAVAKFRTEQASLPYVAPTGAGSGSPLDALTTTKADSLVDTAVAEYNRLQIERNGRPSA